MTRVGLTQRVSVVPEYGERRDCLDQQWTHLLEGLGYTPVPLPNCVDDAEQYLAGLDLDAVVLTSGNDLTSVDDPENPARERDAFETAVLDYALETGLPVLGVCRGLELVNDYFGGTLTPVSDHVACTHTVEFRETAHVGETGSVTLPARATVNSYHDWGIDGDDVGDNLAVVATAADGTVECVVHESQPVWGLMWHPERESPSEDIDRQILTHVLGGTDK